ncbi:MAG: protein kinase [Acidobacteriota bacterium]|nr:protein kinase [Acidobacteriota bacterium]
MSKDFWQKIEEIFPVIADLPAAERDERLRELCAGDEKLRQEISDLLAADAKAGDFCETPAVMPSSLSGAFFHKQPKKPVTLELNGQKFGAYRIVRKIAAGGMGAVYLAVRADGEFEKEVAVKLVKTGADTEFNLRRFRHERQILARLEHPNIARLIDGGTTNSGTPYLVMEYVEGKPLFDYCEAHRLDLSNKIELFQQICAAVSYAHEAGVIHRDLKPGNILVTENGIVKLLDFGISKIFDADSHNNSDAQTATLMRQMTPEYASPEQIKGEKMTPATDVYSLGVLLYELLTGKRPYKFPSRSPHEIARVICEQEVQNPKHEAQTLISDELSFIVLKALRKNPFERYVSVADLSLKVERALAGLSGAAKIGQKSFFEKTENNSDGANVSLAVAPFKIISAENGKIIKSNEDFLGVGLADALTTTLSGVQRLIVRPTSSVLRLTEETVDARALGKELNVDYVLEGHILRGSDQIRVTAQLHKIKDDIVLWAAMFDETDADIFRLQDSISERVAASLVPRLTAEEQNFLRRHGTTNPAAYEAYLRGRFFFHNYTFGGISAAENCFVQSITLDPNFALAYCGFADFYNLQTIYGLTSNSEGFARAKQYALRAIELNPNLGEAYTALAFTTWAYDWDFSEAERLFKKAIRLNPNYARAHEWYAFLLSVTERHEEALVEMQLAEQLDPNSPAVASMFSLVFYNARRYEESFKKARRALELDPDYYIALQSLGWICPRLGKFDEAIESCRRAIRICDEQALNKFSLALALIDAGQIKDARVIAAELEMRRKKEIVPAYYLALLYAYLNEDEKAFGWFDLAIEERGYYTLRMRVEPRLDRLRKDPRFAGLLERIKPLPDLKTTADVSSPKTVELQKPGKFKARAGVFAAVFAAVLAVLVFVGIYAVTNQKIVVKKFPIQHEPHQVEATPANRAASEKPRTNDAVADELYQAGTQQLETRSLEGVNRAIKLFTEATKRDPNFALAFSGLADAHLVLADKDKKAAQTAYKTAEEYALKALALDPDLAEARTSLAMTTYKNTGNFAAAEKHFLRAIEINPSLPRAHHWYSQILRATDRNEDALREIKIAAELDPKSAVIHFNVGAINLGLKRLPEAIAYFDKAIELDAGYVNSYLFKSIAQQMLGDYEAALETYRIGRIYSGKDENEPLWILMQAQAYAANNRRDDALALVNRLLQNPAHRKEILKLSFDVALVYTLLGDAENAFAWLEKIEAKEIKDPNLLKQDPRLANLHKDERFLRFLEKRQKSN